MLAYAIDNTLSESATLRVLYLINRAAEGDQTSAKMLAGVRAGEMTPHQGRFATLHATPRLKGPTKSGAEQRRVLANGTANLQAAVEAFQTLGAPLRAPIEEIDNAVVALKRARFDLFALIGELNKEKSRKENNSA
jgi:hypothetical protein